MTDIETEAYWPVQEPSPDADSLVWVNYHLARKCFDAARWACPTDGFDAANWAHTCSGLSCPTEAPSTLEGERSRMLYYHAFLDHLRDVGELPPSQTSAAPDSRTGKVKPMGRH